MGSECLRLGFVQNLHIQVYDFIPGNTARLDIQQHSFTFPHSHTGVEREREGERERGNYRNKGFSLWGGEKWPHFAGVSWFIAPHFPCLSACLHSLNSPTAADSSHSLFL